MRKKYILIGIVIIVFLSAFFGLNTIRSFDGYYSSIDNVLAHENVTKKGAKKVALIKNGSGHVAVMALDESLYFYSFKTKDSNIGVKYAVAHSSSREINYNNIKNFYPNVEEWNTFSTIIFNKSDERDLQWYVVQQEGAEIQDGIMNFSYQYDGTDYYLLCTFN